MLPPIIDLETYERWGRDALGWHGYKYLRGRCRFLGVPNRLLAQANTGPMLLFAGEHREVSPRSETRPE